MNSPAAILMKRTITDECWVFWGGKLLDLRTIDSMKKQLRSRRPSSSIVYTVLVPFGRVSNALRWRFTLRSLSSSMTLSFNVKENRKCDSSLQEPCLAQNFEGESKSSKNHLKEKGTWVLFVLVFLNVVFWLLLRKVTKHINSCTFFKRFIKVSCLKQ